MILEKLGKYLITIFNEWLEKKTSTNDLLNHGEAIDVFIINKYCSPSQAGHPSFPNLDSRSVPLSVIKYLLDGEPVYDMSNLLISTPKYHKEFWNQDIIIKGHRYENLCWYRNIICY
jgi:hypothetical protein